MNVECDESNSVGTFATAIKLYRVTTVGLSVGEGGAVLELLLSKKANKSWPAATASISGVTQKATAPASCTGEVCYTHGLECKAPS